MLNSTSEPSKIAEYVLNEIWENTGYPVDPISIANKMGIKVITSELPEQVSGALIKDKGKDPLIILSKIDSKNRKRFSCAHELGHYIKRVQTDVQTDNDNYEYIDYRNGNSSIGTVEEEIFANQFAACLLMPEKEVKIQCQKTPFIAFLAQYFSVSDDAILFRLKNLGLYK